MTRAEKIEEAARALLSTLPTLPKINRQAADLAKTLADLALAVPEEPLVRDHPFQPLYGTTGGLCVECGLPHNAPPAPEEEK